MNIDEMTPEQMDELARQGRNAYRRAWYQKNREKAKEYQRRHHAKKALQMLAEAEGGGDYGADC